MDIEQCLPVELRARGAVITRIAAGLSGAGVHRVEVGGEAYVLKTTDARDPVEAWRARTGTLARAAAAGLAPRVVHADEERRAVLSAFVADHGFVARYADPARREGAIALLGATLRRVHELPLPSGAVGREPREVLAWLWSQLAGMALPAFVGEAVGLVLDAAAPPAERAPVLSHNDVNPTNLVHDGERLMLLDWDMAGPNDPLYDLAAASLFLRLDHGERARLLAVHDAAPVASVPARFAYLQRVIAALCGAVFLRMADAGYIGSRDETLASAPDLGAVRRRMAGELAVARPDGQWAFGLALVKASVTS